MSDWWGGGDDSGEESDLYSSDEEGARTGGGDVAKTRAFTLDDSSSEDEGKRVVKSKKDARFDDVKKALDVIAAKLKINDWVAISEEWSNLEKKLARTRAVFEQSGVPRFVATGLIALEEAITKTGNDKSNKKTMKLQNFKSFTKMKQTWKKFNRAEVPGLEEKLAHVRAHPDEESEGEEEEGSDEDTKKGKGKGKDKKDKEGKALKKLAKKDVDAWFTAEDDDDDSDEKEGGSDKGSDEGSDDSSDEGEDDDDEEEDVYILGEKRDISYWFTPDKEKTGKKMDKKEARAEKKKERATKAAAGEDGNEADAEDAGTKRKGTASGTTSSTVTGDAGEKKEEWTQEKVDKKLKELLAKRGTKSYERSEAQRVLALLLTKAEGVQNVLVLKFHVLNTHFDAAAHARNGTLPRGAWKRAYNALVDLLRTLHSLVGQVTLYESGEDLARALGEDAGEKPLPPQATSGHLTWALEHLCDEYARSLQQVESHSARYVALLAQERDLLLLLQCAQHYYARTGHKVAETAMAARQLDLLYYKRAQDVDRAPAALLNASELDGAADGAGDEAGEDESISASVDLSSSSASLSSSSASLSAPNANANASGVSTPALGAAEGEEEVDADEDVVLERPPHSAPVTGAELCARVEVIARSVYRHSAEDRAKRRAMLQHVYHLALHERFYEGRDMLLMSHLPDKISRAKLPEQVLYNRVLVQLGLCAFRLGRVKEAHACLAEVASSGRTKELLAQGLMNRYGQQQSERSTEQEQEERARQVPYHMHIALDLIELAHMLSAMLLEVPNMALARHRALGTQPRKVISKAFRRMLDNYERQVFTGPPENTREHVLVAGRLLLLGEWRRARQELFAVDAWRLVTDAPKVQMLLESQIRETALRTYVLAALPHYKSLSLVTLATMFDLHEGAVHATISRMIGSQELSAAWDQRSGALIPHVHAHVEPSALQAFALHFADRAGALLDASEPYDAQNRQQQRDGQQQHHQQQQEGGEGQHQGGGGQRRYGQRNNDGRSGDRRAYVNAPRSDRRVKGAAGGSGSGSGRNDSRDNNANRTRR